MKNNAEIITSHPRDKGVYVVDTEKETNSLRRSVITDVNDEKGTCEIPVSSEVVARQIKNATHLLPK